VKLRVFSPSEPEQNAPYLKAILPPLSGRMDVLESEGEDADLDLYPIGDGPAFASAYRAALRRPGVVLLHQWNLHALVSGETLGRGELSAYLREMRRAGGARGTFVARQVARGLGGDLSALLPLNDRLLEGSLAVIALTGDVRSRVGRALPGRPVLQLPLHLLPSPTLGPSRAEARRAAGLREHDLLLRAAGEAGSLARAKRVADRLRADFPSLRLDLGVAPEGPLPLAAADISLFFGLSRGSGVPRELVLSLALGIPTLVTAGAPGTEDFPEGGFVTVDPGPREEEELGALLRLLLGDPALRHAIGRLAREHLSGQKAPVMADRLAGFLAEVLGGKEAALSALASDRAPAGSRLDYLMEEVRWAARDLGLSGLRLGLQGLLAPLGKGPS
jgi:glycosyltransferase involved in cell wall biosynthesis